MREVHWPKKQGVANNIIMAIDSLAVVFGTLVIEYHLLFGVDVPNKPLFHFPEQEFTHLINIIIIIPSLSPSQQKQFGQPMR